MALNTISSKKTARRKKSTFYHVRFNKVGLNEERAAEVLGCSIDDVKYWDFEGNLLAERYLQLWDRKHVGIQGWDGWLFTRGVLKHKNMQFTPATILMSYAAIDRASNAEYELRKLVSLLPNSQHLNSGLIDLTTEFGSLIK